LVYWQDSQAVVKIDVEIESSVVEIVIMLVDYALLNGERRENTKGKGIDYTCVTIHCLNVVVTTDTAY
jgi:hypothetical protein